MALHFQRGSPFDADERRTLEQLYQAVGEGGHPERARFQEQIRATTERVDGLAQALDRWPPLSAEASLGGFKRSPATLVDRLGKADDASLDMFLPTQAQVSRALLMAELNAWRHMRLVASQVLPDVDGRCHPLADAVDRWVYTCVYTRLTEELLLSIVIDQDMERRVREGAVADLIHIWQDRLTARVAPFFRLLEAVWEARRRIRVSQGTLLGVSEIFRLLQVGCDPEFMEYFSRPLCTGDEGAAFREFLIGVSTERIRSLEQYMEQAGKPCIDPEEAPESAPAADGEMAANHPAIQAYRFFRERHLQAAARRRSGREGPKKTAEEYVMIYFLQQQGR